MVIKVRKTKCLDNRFIIVKKVVAYLVKYRSEIMYERRVAFSRVAEYREGIYLAIRKRESFSFSR